MEYKDFIIELKDLLKDTNELFDKKDLDEDDKFRKWRHKSTDLINNIESRGYSINCDIYNRRFNVFAPYATVRESERLKTYNRELQDTINEFETIIENYEKYGCPKEKRAKANTNNISENKVFIVHGHDNLAKQEVARLIEKLDLEAVILHEQPDQGQTIIEKFENHSSDISFAVVVCTPDDKGFPKSEPEKLKFRARQNVILELGYFLGALGRKNVCVLYKDEIERPSDYVGVLYKKMDDDGAWCLELAKEMRAAGLDIDLNKLA